MKIGYARVSTADQNLQPQIEILNEFGCKKIYQDKISSTKKHRPGLDELKNHLRSGDTLVVYKIDRIFRSLKDMVELIEWLKEKEIGFVSVSEPAFDTTSANGSFLLQIFAAFAEFERNLISERTKLGLANARKRKKKLGRPLGVKLETLEKFEYAKHLFVNKNTPIDKACKLAGISKASYYRVKMLNY